MTFSPFVFADSCTRSDYLNKINSILVASEASKPLIDNASYIIWWPLEMNAENSEKRFGESITTSYSNLVVNYLELSAYDNVNLTESMKSASMATRFAVIFYQLIVFNSQFEINQLPSILWNDLNLNDPMGFRDHLSSFSQSRKARTTFLQSLFDYLIEAAPITGIYEDSKIDSTLLYGVLSQAFSEPDFLDFFFDNLTVWNFEKSSQNFEALTCKLIRSGPRDLQVFIPDNILAGPRSLQILHWARRLGVQTVQKNF